MLYFENVVLKSIFEPKREDIAFPVMVYVFEIIKQSSA
jgi:hypothetical protein